MRITIILIGILLGVTACTTEDTDNLNSKYNSMYGNWKPTVVVYDSAGVNVMHSIIYDKMVINPDLTYSIYSTAISPVEDGEIQIVSQSDDKLKLFFSAHYPPYSSYAGSHIFGISDVDLTYISDTVMTLKSNNDPYHFNPEYYFWKIK